MKRLLLTTLLIPLPMAALAEGDLHIYAWANSISPEVIARFEEETGIRVTVDGFSSNEDALTKLQAGSSGFDLVTPSQHFVKIMIDQGLLEPIDVRSMAAFQSIEPEWAGQWWDPENAYSMPLAAGTAGFAVNRDLYQGPADSWAVLFEPGSDLQGRIGMLSYPDEIIGAAQLYLGIPFCTEDARQMKRVYDLLSAQKPFVAAYSSDNIETRLGGGEVAAHFWWDGNAMKLRRNDGKNIEFAMPKEGLVGWMDSFVVPKGAENVENAKRFIDFISMPENATIQYNFYGHTPPVKLDPAKAELNEANAPEIFPTVKVEYSQACSPAAQDLVTKVWTQLLQ